MTTKRTPWTRTCSCGMDYLPQSIGHGNCPKCRASAMSTERLLDEKTRLAHIDHLTPLQLEELSAINAQIDERGNEVS
jgi:hypothetical protein